jgi:hypothetical protein
MMALLLGAVLFAAAPAAAEPQSIGEFGAWEAAKFENAGDAGCFMTSDPTKSEGKYSNRGKVYALITHRPTNNALNVVTFVAGYTYMKDSEVTVEVGDQKFSLFTDQSSAWARDEDDGKLVAAMRAGNTMIVRGTSERGTLTTDTYSLRGFTKAHGAIGEACGVSP